VVAGFPACLLIWEGEAGKPATTRGKHFNYVTFTFFFASFALFAPLRFIPVFDPFYRHARVSIRLNAGPSEARATVTFGGLPRTP